MHGAAEVTLQARLRMPATIAGAYSYVFMYVIIAGTIEYINRTTYGDRPPHVDYQGDLSPRPDDSVSLASRRADHVGSGSGENTTDWQPYAK